jgi:hypothetical protein
MYKYHEGGVVTLNVLQMYMLMCESGIRWCVLMHTSLQASSAEIFQSRCSLPGEA